MVWLRQACAVIICFHGQAHRYETQGKDDEIDYPMPTHGCSVRPITVHRRARRHLKDLRKTDRKRTTKVLRLRRSILACDLIPASRPDLCIACTDDPSGLRACLPTN